MSEYAYIYNVTETTVEPDANVRFDSSGVVSPGIIRSTSPNTGEIVLVNPGTYKVAFSVSAIERSQIALFVNGDLVPGSVYGSDAGAQQNSGQAIIAADAGDVLTVANHTSDSAITLVSLIGGAQAAANASVLIEKLD